MNRLVLKSNIWTTPPAARTVMVVALVSRARPVHARPILAALRHLAVAMLLAIGLAPVALAQDVRIGVLANRGTAQAQALWQPVADYLAHRILDTRFEIVPLDYKELPLAVEAGKVDFFIANGSVFVDLEVRLGAEPLATLRSRVDTSWSTHFGGVVITRADNPELRTLVDLKGHTFMATEETSLGGFLAGWRELRRAGLDPYRDFSILRFGGTHDAVVFAVRDQAVDAGTLRTDILERMAREGVIALDDFRVLNPKRHAGFPYLCSTELYPEWLIAKARHVPDELARRVATVLITMPPQSEAAMSSQSAGWTDPVDYTPVRELMQELGIGPYSEQPFTIGEAARAYGGYLALVAACVLVLAAVMCRVCRLNRRLRRADLALREAHDELAAKVQARTDELTAILSQLDASRRREALAHRDWHDAFDAITDPIFIHDRNGCVVHANPAYLARAGMTAEAALGLRYWEVFPRMSEPLISCREFLHGKSGLGISELRLETGEMFVSRSFGVQGADGIRSAIHILEDVTAERRAEAERRMLSHAVAQAGEGVVITGVDGHVTYANPAFVSLVGGAATDLRETPLRDLFVAADRKRIDDILPRLTAGGWTGELSLRPLADAQVPMFVTASAFYGDGGHAGFILTLMDLRSIKEAEQALTFRLAFESVVGAIAARFVAVDVSRFDTEMNAALSRIGASVSADHAYLFRYDAANGYLRNTHAWCGGTGDAPSRLRDVKLADLPWIAERMARFEAIHVPNIDDLPGEAARERAMLSATGVRSVLMVPLAAGESVIGMLGFDTAHAPKHWAPEDILLLRAVGEIVASTLRRLEAEAAVRRSEESLTQAQRVAQLGNWDWDVAADIVTWSAEIYRIFGLEPHEFGAKFSDFLALVHPNDRATVEEEVAKALRRECDFSIDHRIVLRDGRERIVHQKAMVLCDDDGVPTRLIGTLQDVTAARYAEGELQRLNRSLRTLSRANETLVRAKVEPDLLRDICEVLVHVGGYRLAWVGYAEHDAACTVTPMAHAGDEAGYLQTVRMTWSEKDAPVQAPAGIAIRTGTPYLARDVNSEPEIAPWREEALRRGYASVIALPLRAGDAILGSLTIDAAEADAFDDAEVRLLRELADDLAFGIMTLRNRRLREQAEEESLRSERRYHELYDNAPTAYVSVAVADGAILQANAATVRFLGYSREELLGMKVFEFQDPGAEGDDSRELFEHFRADRRVRDKEVRMRRRDGRTVWVSLSIEPVRDLEGRLIESRASLLDISARKRMEEEKGRIAQQLQKALVQTIEAIAITIEKRDPYTAGHQTRVAQLAVAIGRELGLDAERLQGLRLGAQIHDIGKIYVPAEFLNRPGDLAGAELDIIRWHPLMGYDIVKGIDFPWPVAEMVVQHHERLDGSGYPRGLKADAIKLEARIIAVADVAEAMASHRPYRAALPLEAALTELETYKGVRYDPDAAEACLRLFRAGHFGWEDDPLHIEPTASEAGVLRVGA